MAYRHVDLAVGEWFHCYTRTIDRSHPFKDIENIKRFLETLYLCNQLASMPVMPEVYRRHSHEQIFSMQRAAPLVAIGAYCIMPTHYHLLVQPIREKGLSEFMHKVGTGFTRFYNDRHDRIGNLFVKPFRAKHIASDSYFNRVATYIHLNPLELFEPEWKRGKIRDISNAEKALRTYEHSSFLAYEGIIRAEQSILDKEAVSLIKAELPAIRNSINEAVEYYQFLELDL